MAKSEEYRQQAEEMERTARTISLSTDRASYLALAKGWRDLAEAAEEMEARAQGSPAAGAPKSP
jgi:hypothetical protein